MLISKCWEFRVFTWSKEFPFLFCIIYFFNVTFNRLNIMKCWVEKINSFVLKCSRIQLSSFFYYDIKCKYSNGYKKLKNKFILKRKFYVKILITFHKGVIYSAYMDWISWIWVFCVNNSGNIFQLKFWQMRPIFFLLVNKNLSFALNNLYLNPTKQISIAQ